jgi:uncharacterized protein YxjI
MGLLRGDEPDGTRLLMREKLLSVGDDSWVQNDSGDNVYKVNGKKLRVQETFVLEDPSGNEVLHIQARDLRMRGVMKIERDGDTVATVTKKVIGIRDRFSIDLEHGADLDAKGNVVDHEYEVKRDGDVVASITKKWVRVRESYGIEIATGEDVALLVAVAVAIQSLAR